MLHCSRLTDDNASVHSRQDYESLQMLLQSVQMLQTDTELADAKTIATEHYFCSESEREALTQKRHVKLQQCTRNNILFYSMLFIIP